MNKEKKLRLFSSKFFGIKKNHVPDQQDELKNALIAESIRLAIWNSKRQEKGWPIIHINSLRNWVTRKLGAIMHLFNGKPTTEDDWFFDILKGKKGPNIVFLGEVIELSKGYYTLSPSRIVKGNDSSEILISGYPTSYFSNTSIEIKPVGVTRILLNNSIDDSSKFDIPIVSKERFVGLDKNQKFDKEIILNFIENNTCIPWEPREGWVSYEGKTFGYGFTWGENPQKIVIDGKEISLWKEENEYSINEYWLKVSDEKEKMIKIPSRLYKQICLLIDSLNQRKRIVKTKRISEKKVQISFNFDPPAFLFRWIYATGGVCKGYNVDRLIFEIPKSYWDSTVDLLEKLPIKVMEDR